MCNSTPSRCSDRVAFSPQLGTERLEHTLAAVEQQHSGFLGLDAVKLVRQSPGGHLADLPGKLHAGGPSTGHGECQPTVALGSRWQRLGDFKGGEDPLPDVKRIVERLHPRRPLGEVLLAEVGLLHSRGHDEYVVVDGERRLVRPASGHLTGPRVDVDRFPEQGGDIAMAGELLAQRTTDLPEAQRPGGTLVEQRLEQVSGRPVEQGHVDVDAAEASRAEQTAESPTDDQHPHPTVVHP